MFTKLVMLIATGMGKAGSKIAVALLPYLLYLTPLLVAVACGFAFYATHKADVLGLVLAALVVANEAYFALELYASRLQSPPSRS